MRETNSPKFSRDVRTQLYWLVLRHRKLAACWPGGEPCLSSLMVFSFIAELDILWRLFLMRRLRASPWSRVPYGSYPGCVKIVPPVASKFSLHVTWTIDNLYLHAYCKRKHFIDHVSLVLASFATAYLRTTDSGHGSRRQHKKGYVLAILLPWWACGSLTS